MRHPITIRRALIKHGAFIGVERLDLASALDIASAECTALLLSEQEPRSIFGVAAKESRGTRMLAWFKNGQQV